MGNLGCRSRFHKKCNQHSKNETKTEGPTAEGRRSLCFRLRFGISVDFFVESRPAAQIGQFGISVDVFVELNYFAWTPQSPTRFPIMELMVDSSTWLLGVSRVRVHVHYRWLSSSLSCAGLPAFTLCLPCTEYRCFLAMRLFPTSTRTFWRKSN